MNNFFMLLAIVGVSYLSVAVAISKNPVTFKNKFRQQFSPDRLSKPFQSEKMQSVLNKTGWDISAKKVNIFRTFLIVGVLITSYGNSFLKQDQLTHWPIVICVIIFFCTSSARFTPSGWLLERLQQRILIRKDGELISFLKLYENTRMKQTGYIQFNAFCLQIAPHFELIGKDLMGLSERVVEDGLENALNWFVEQFPKKHPFISDIRAILITVESMKDQEAISRHFRSQSNIIAKISSDQYERRWKFIGDIATIFTTVPSILIFVMVIALVLLYVQIVRDGFSEVGLI